MWLCLWCAHSPPPNDEPIPLCDPGFHRVQHVVEWLTLAGSPQWLAGYSNHCDWAVIALWLVAATVFEVVVTRGWSQERRTRKARTVMGGSKPIFQRAAANAYACMTECRAAGCRPNSSTQHMNGRAIFPMSSPCAVLVLVSLQSCTPHSIPKFIDRQGQGQGAPMDRPNERRRVFPRPTAALGRRRGVRLGVWMLTSDGRCSRLGPGWFDVTIRLSQPFPLDSQSDIDRPPLDRPARNRWSMQMHMQMQILVGWSIGSPAPWSKVWPLENLVWFPRENIEHCSYAFLPRRGRIHQYQPGPRLADSQQGRTGSEGLSHDHPKGKPERETAQVGGTVLPPAGLGYAAPTDIDWATNIATQQVGNQAVQAPGECHE